MTTSLKRIDAEIATLIRQAMETTDPAALESIGATLDAKYLARHEAIVESAKRKAKRHFAQVAR